MKRFLKSRLILSMVTLVVLGAIFAVPLVHISHAQAAPTMTLQPSSGAPGTVVTVTGSGWNPGHLVDIRFGNSGPSIATPTVASDGTFSTTITIPSNAALGPLSINADEAGVNGQATFTVTAPVPTPTPTPITVNCPDVQTIATFSEREVISGTVSLNSSDPKEASDHEPLTLEERNDRFTRLIATIKDINTLHEYSFTAGANQDTLVACINGEGGRGDEQGDVTVINTLGLKLNLNEPHEPSSAELKEQGKLNPVVLEIFKAATCLADVLTTGKVGAILHIGSRIIKIVDVTNKVVGRTTTIFAVLKDVQTGDVSERIISVVGDFAQNIPFESCGELFVDFFFQPLPPSTTKPPIIPVPVPTPTPPSGH